MLLGLLAQGRGVQLGAVAPRLFRATDRQHGVVDDNVGGGAGLGNRDAHAGGDEGIPVAEMEGLAQRVEEALGALEHRCALLHGLEDHHEFVVVEAGDGVRRGGVFSQADRRGTPQLVAALVSALIIEALEAVEIDEAHADLAGCARRPQQCSLEPVDQQHPFGRLVTGS